MSPDRGRADARTVSAVAAALVVAVIALYAPVTGYGFVSYDDPEYVLENVRVHRGLSWDGVEWAFAHAHSANWHPLTWLSHMLDWQLYGAWAGGHHLTSVLLHAANAALLLVALWRMTGALWRSALVAAVFAVHPLRVESVAWISERKDVLCGFGWMLALVAYARYVRWGGRGRYLAVALAVVLALLAKPMAVTLPFVLLLLDVWPLGRLGDDPSRARVRALVVEKMPLVALAAATAVITYRVQSDARAVTSLEDEPLGERIAAALHAYVVYLRRLVWPDDLAFFHPPPAAIPIAAWGGAALGLAGLTALVVWQWRRRPYLAVGWLWFVGTLVPVIGIVHAGEQYTADRFTYVPAIGIVILVVWGLADWVPAAAAHVAVAAAVIGVVAAGGATRAELRAWRDSRALYEHALEVSAGNHVAEGNLGLLMLGEGRTAEAFTYLERAAQTRPASAKAQMNYGVALAAVGRPDDALARYELATQLDPHYAAAFVNLGKALADARRLAEAEAAYREAIRLDPDYAKAHAGLGFVLAAEGRTMDAIDAYRRALRLAPEMVDVHNNLALALEHAGAADDALAEYRESVRLDPHEPRARFNLAGVLLGRGAYEEAVGHYRAVLAQQPELTEAYGALGVALEALGRSGDATAMYAEALRRRPEWTEIAARLARLDGASGAARQEARP